MGGVVVGFNRSQICGEVWVYIHARVELIFLLIE